MNKKLLILLCFLLYGSTIYAQFYKPTVPSYNDTTLRRQIKELYYLKEERTNNYYPKNVSPTAYRDTIISIFSQFSVGKDVVSKNANLLTADISSKESRLSYNAAAYSKKWKGIYNAEIFASGKDNLANIFSKGKTQGKFGLNVSGSFLFSSSLFYDSFEADTLHYNRLLYAWTLEDKANTITDDAQKKKVKNEIIDLETRLATNDLGTYKSKEEVFSKLTLLQDSIKKFLPLSKKASHYAEKLKAYDRKHAKWTGFSLWTLDWKIGYSREGFSHYAQVVWPVTYPDIADNAYQFSRWNARVSGNYIRSSKYYSSKTSVGVGFSNFTGFDGESPDEIIQSTDYHLSNVRRSIEKKYTAYEFKPSLTEKYDGTSFIFNQQFLFGKKKLFGLGFNHQSTLFINGSTYKDKIAIDHTYTLLLALSKKGDVLNKNVLAINITTPDLKRDLKKSFDSKTGERLRMRDKLEIGITFGLTIEKLLGQ